MLTILAFAALAASRQPVLDRQIHFLFLLHLQQPASGKMTTNSPSAVQHASSGALQDATSTTLSIPGFSREQVEGIVTLISSVLDSKLAGQPMTSRANQATVVDQDNGRGRQAEAHEAAPGTSSGMKAPRLFSHICETLT